MGSHAGKTIIVTGASSGIGRACTERLSAEGALVVGADVKESLGEAGGGSIGLPAEAESPAPPGSQGSPGTTGPAFVLTDVTDEDSVIALVARAREFSGRIDGVVNAAGVAGGGPVHLLDSTEWNRVLSVNLTGTFLVAKHVITQMLSQERVNNERGSVVTIASIEGLEGTAGGSAYSASKGGVVLLTKNMAIDYGGVGIRVNTICPGFIDTPMTRPGIFDLPGMEQVSVEFVREHKLGRFGQPEEIASAASFLLSADASFITGHALVADGGYTAGRDHGVTQLLGLDGP